MSGLDVETAAPVGFNASVSEARGEVLVVGAGPSGLFSAVELARHGISFRLVEVANRDTEGEPARLDSSAALLVRPDGHVGFRAVPADAGGIEALDAHLASYLVPA